MEIKNKKAYHDYFVDEEFECGIELRGNEVKSIRYGMCSLRDAWCTVQDGDFVIRGMRISAWKTANDFDIDEVRERRLLVHKYEIAKIVGVLKAGGGITYIPLKVYFNKKNKCKVLVGKCRGKKNYDKRQAIKERDLEREARREDTL